LGRGGSQGGERGAQRKNLNKDNGDDTICDVEQTFWQFVGLGEQPYFGWLYIYSQSAILKTKKVMIMCFFFCDFQ
jgi:hypothetical protein